MAFVRFKCKSLDKDFQLSFINKVKKPRKETTHGILLVSCNDENLQIKQQILAHSGTMDKWVTDKMHDVSKFLSRIAAYRELLPLLFAFNLQNYSRYLTYHHFEFQALKHKHFSAYEQLKIYEMGASLTERKFLNIPEDLVTVVTASREVKIPGGPVQGGYSTFVEAVDGFILNKHTYGVH